jgi:hypothetical protein
MAMLNYRMPEEDKDDIAEALNSDKITQLAKEVKLD